MESSHHWKYLDAEYGPVGFLAALFGLVKVAD
jgi:hypothetical protein